VQKSPAWPVYVSGGHALVTWSAPLRGKEAEKSELETAGLTLGLTGFTDPPAHPTAARAAAPKNAMTTRCVARLMISLLLIASGGFEPGLRGICHERQALE
jgi:hypothetical protein